MKNFKFLGVLILALCFSACEQEQLDSTKLDSSVSETMFIQIDENGRITYQSEKQLNLNNTFKNSESENDFRIYNNETEFFENCSSFYITTNIGVITSGSGISWSYNPVYYVKFDANSENVLDDMQAIFYDENSIEIGRMQITNSGFYGFSSSEHIRKVEFTGQNTDLFTLNNLSLGNCEYVPEIIDSDGDGIPDDEDLMPNSNMEETVMIEGCDSMVENIPLGDGIMLSDVIDELEAGDYKNHGQYTRATAKYLAGLVEEGVISQEEMDMIMECAGSSSLGV